MEIQMKTKKLTPQISSVEIDGEIDVYTSPKVREVIHGLIDEGQINLIINLEKVKYIDSTGLGVLIGSLKRVREKNGCINLICTDSQIKKIFSITGLNKIFGIYKNEEEAMKKII